MTAPVIPPIPPIPPAQPLHRVLGLTDGELEAICEKLGRDPNDLELAMFSVMWSEHCSYKSSRPLLATLPTKGEDVVAGVGEQAGDLLPRAVVENARQKRDGILHYERRPDPSSPVIQTDSPPL